METIKCPNCGSEKVQGVTEEKYVCLACDNVFLVHNLSKEFRQTDAHISDVHKDLKEEINKIASGSGLNEAVLLEKAEEHLKKENWISAYEVYSQLAEEFPQHSAGWFGKYKALTGNFSQVERYARFVCEGNYVDLDDDADDSERVNFEGNMDIKCALDCADADKALITREVTQFIKRCAEYGKADIENSIKQGISVFQGTLKERDDMKVNASKMKRNDQIKALIPAFIVVILLILSFKYFMAAGDWLGKIIGIVAFVLVIKFGGRRFINSIKKAKAEGDEWTNVLSESTIPLVDDMDNHVQALMYYCVDLDNYNHILKSVQNEEQFIQTFITNPLEGLTFYSEVSENKERFVFELLDGKIEKYRYLLEGSDN